MLGFIQVCHVGRRVHFGSLGSFGRPLGVVRFVQALTACLWAHSGVACGRRVHLGAPWGPFGRPLIVVGLIRVRWVHSGATGG